MDVKTFEKQDAIFLGSKSGALRYYRNVGLGFKTVSE
jgi:hypothetical protein